MTANPNLFKKYKSDIFYESGTYHGDSVKAALDAGFERIVSTEVFEPIFNKTRVLFEGNQFVSCLYGDTVTVLKSVLPTFVGKKVTFWLDGHYSGPGTGGEKNPFPIIEELEAILAAKNSGYISRPIILIDDMRLLKDKELQMIEIIKKIESTYIFDYEDGVVQKDILVAY